MEDYKSKILWLYEGETGDSEKNVTTWVIHHMLSSIIMEHEKNIKNKLNIDGNLVLWMYNYWDRIRFYLWELEQLEKDNFEIRNCVFKKEIFTYFPYIKSYDKINYKELWRNLENFCDFIDSK